MAKATVVEIGSRISVKPDTAEGIQKFDVDNKYPQRIRNAKKSSPRATQCVNISGKFIRGNGFKDPFFKTIVNELKRLTVDKLHRELVKDFALYRGFAIHLNYDANGKIVSMTPMPFEELRLGIADDQGVVSTIKHHPDWGKEVNKNFKKDLITEYDVFNPDPVDINKQAAEAGGFALWNGQIYYYSANGRYKYPEASCDPVLEDVVSDDEAKQFRLNNISTNFLASHILEVNEFTDPKEREKFAQLLKGFQGAKKSSRILILEKKTEETSFNLKPVEIQKVDDLFEKTENSTLESIRRNYMLLPVLLGDLVSGKLGTAQEIKDAIEFTNNFIFPDERMIFEETFTELFEHWHDPNANPSKDFTVTPLTISPTVAG